MRRIERTTAFQRDFKREKRGPHRHELDSLICIAVTCLAENKLLPVKNRDHALGGTWSDLKSDLLLIYRKPSADVLQLVRLGSHSELFG